MIAAQTPYSERPYDDIEGAKIVSVTRHAQQPYLLVIEFAHRGTDDGSGYFHVPMKDVHFGDDLA